MDTVVVFFYSYPVGQTNATTLSTSYIGPIKMTDDEHVKTSHNHSMVI